VLKDELFEKVLSKMLMLVSFAKSLLNRFGKKVLSKQIAKNTSSFGKASF